MDFERILNKKNKYAQNKSNISSVTLKSYEKDFELRFTHNSTAIEGNTLTLMETKVVLEDGVSIGGKALREIYEVINHKNAYEYVKKCILESKPLTEDIVKDLHALLTENIIIGGIYRSQEVRISGAGFTPPAGNEMYVQIKRFYDDLESLPDINPIELAAWTHAEFVRIHPFIDGNGRTARLLMNYQLLLCGFLPVSIDKDSRLDYYNALEEYAVNNNLKPFADLVAVLEEQQLDEYLKLIEKSENERDTGIRAIVLNEICELAKKNNIEKVVLFGSRARGDYRTTSDIDLAVSGGNIAGFTLDVDETTSTLLKYDVINLDMSVQQPLRDAIEKEGRIIYEKI